MAVTPIVRDWPREVRPSASLFIASGQAVPGGMTVRSVLVEHGEPGGRAAMDWTFNHMKNAITIRQAAWLMSMTANGTVWRVKVPVGAQLVSLGELGLVTEAQFLAAGLPWNNDVLWSNGRGWDIDVGGLAVGSALEGTVSLSVDLATLSPGLDYGHVIGVGDRAHHVEEIEYDGSVAQLTLSPPLREDVADGTYVTFRPTMLATVADVASFRQMLEFGLNLRPGNLRFTEALI